MTTEKPPKESDKVGPAPPRAPLTPRYMRKIIIYSKINTVKIKYKIQ